MNIDDYFAKNWDLGISLTCSLLHYGIPVKDGHFPIVDDMRLFSTACLFYSHSALLSQDHEGRLNFYNPAAQNVFGYTPEEAIGMPSVELVPHWLRPGRAEKFKHVLEKMVCVVVPNEERITKDQRVIRISATVFPYFLGGKPSIAAKVTLL